jgi:hypothetical protein
VSHEEALAGQAIRENAMVYDSLVSRYLESPGKGRRLLDQAAEVLRKLGQTRENYHMIDDEFQLPVLVARYLGDSSVSSDRKRRFLLENSDRTPRLQLLLRELELATSLSAPYVSSPRAGNLVSFPRRDATHWRSASWRDSDAGYAGGRFAMDINTIWVPAALQSIAEILRTLPDLGLAPESLDSLLPGRESPLAGYLRDSTSLSRVRLRRFEAPSMPSSNGSRKLKGTTGDAFSPGNASPETRSPSWRSRWMPRVGRFGS